MSVKASLLGMTVLGALLVLAACNGGGGDSTATPSPETTPTVVPSPPAELCPRIDGEVVQSVVALLELDRTTFRQGEPVQMTMRLVNCASEPITRTFPDAQRYDFAAGKPQEAKEDGSGPVPAGAGDCNDTEDNDNDTFVDAADPECVPPPAVEVWRWSSGQTFPETQGEETYQPGQQLTFTETWDQTDNEGQPVEPGRYELTTESTGCDESLQNCGPTASLFIEITAP